MSRRNFQLIFLRLLGICRNFICFLSAMLLPPCINNEIQQFVLYYTKNYSFLSSNGISVTKSGWVIYFPMIRAFSFVMFD